MTGLSITKSSAPDSHKTYSVDTKCGISDYNKQILSFLFIYNQSICILIHIKSRAIFCRRTISVFLVIRLTINDLSSELDCPSKSSMPYFEFVGLHYLDDSLDVPLED
jgi:hypothetical protein